MLSQERNPPGCVNSSSIFAGLEIPNLKSERPAKISPGVAYAIRPSVVRRPEPMVNITASEQVSVIDTRPLMSRMRNTLSIARLAFFGTGANAELL